MDAFRKFETALDSKLHSLGIYDKPLRAILVRINMMVSSCCSKEQLDETIENRCDCNAFPSLFSYMLELFDESDTKTLGASALDILSTLDENDYKDMKFLLHYARFCEYAPFVWRKIYKYSLEENTLMLEYNDDYQDSEVKDIILTELAIPPRIGFDSKPKDIKMTSNTPQIIQKFFDYVTPEKYDEEVKTYTLYRQYGPEYKIFVDGYKTLYKEFWFDDPMISGDICRAYGFTKNDLIEFITFWLAYSNYLIELSQATLRYIKCNGEGTSADNEYLELISPFFKKEGIFKMFGEHIIGVNLEKFLVLMTLFSAKVDDDLTRYKDGYYPVFFEFDNAYLFSPYVIRSRLSLRNMLYIFLKTDQKKFDNEISKSLEPNLIEHAVSLFQGLLNVTVKTNNNWKKGEFDMLVHFAEKNIVLHIQAKGTMPPEGARMTKRLEERMKEGVKQLNEFKKLNPDNKDEILSNVFEKNLKGVKVIDVLLGWGGFGTKDIWDLMDVNDIAPLNLSLLKKYVKGYQEGQYDIDNFVSDMNELVEEFVSITNPQIEMDEIIIDSKKIIYPALRHDSTKLVKYKYIVK